MEVCIRFDGALELGKYGTLLFYYYIVMFYNMIPNDYIVSVMSDYLDEKL